MRETTIVDYGTNTVTYNSFATIAEADNYHSRRLGNNLWISADNEVKTKAIFNATDILHRQNWIGVPTDYEQNLAFPRMYVPSRNSIDTDDDTVSQRGLGRGYAQQTVQYGYSYLPSDSIPQFVKDATAELANFFIVKDASGKNEMSQYDDQVSDIKLGNMTIKLREENNYITSLPHQVLFMIKDFLETIKETDSSIKIVRSVAL